MAFLYYFYSICPIASNIISKPEKKSKRTTAHFFLSFFLWNLGISWWIWNASAFGMFFAVIVNSSLMTVVFMLRTVIKLSKQAGLFFLTTY